VSTYNIGDIAERSGFTTSALRYYEKIGLLTPATRSGAGYRIYDEQTLERLAFISRAKQLGCSLEEITELVGTWERDRCEPVQRRFHTLVTEKIRDAQRQITELTTFTAQLQTAAAQLGSHPIDGPCADDCACIAHTTLTSCATVEGSPATKPGDPPIACTLESEAIPDRLAEWQAVLDRAVSRTTATDGALRVEFDDPIHLSELARLVAAEQHCCAFFSFTITVDVRGIALEVRASDGASDIVAFLFGQPA
jgi:DNA-binding transcriptional MerR regulator